MHPSFWCCCFSRAGLGAVVTSGQLLSECATRLGRGNDGREKVWPARGADVGRGCWRNGGRKGLLVETEGKLLFWRFFQTIALTRNKKPQLTTLKTWVMERRGKMCFLCVWMTFLKHLVFSPALSPRKQAPCLHAGT